jgi:hypothetical protein
MSDIRNMIKDLFHKDDQKPSTLEQQWKTKNDLETFAATRPDYSSVKNSMYHLLKEDKYGNAQIATKNGKLDLERAYCRASHPTCRDSVFLAIQGLKDKS